MAATHVQEYVKTHVQACARICENTCASTYGNRTRDKPNRIQLGRLGEGAHVGVKPCGDELSNQL